MVTPANPTGREQLLQESINNYTWNKYGTNLYFTTGFSGFGAGVVGTVYPSGY